jgi:hypothetical protein
MDELRVRIYNVRFGDAILISIPDKKPGGSTEIRHILIDVGNSAGTEGGLDRVFEPVMQDVIKELNGHPLDLYVMTHEHMDHVQGLQYFQKKGLNNKAIKDILQVRYTWMTRSSHPNYYKPNTREYNEKARQRRDMVGTFLDEARQFFKAVPDEENDWIRGLMAINNPKVTADCVDLIRGLAPDNTHYIYRGLNIKDKHPFQEATFEIWAPEEDTSIYYGHFHPVAFGISSGPDSQLVPAATEMEPPPGVDAGAFYNLVEHRLWGYGDNLLSIDSAANNTSIVFCLNWRGWKLLFPGDAEVRSWKEMDKRHLLSPVHFFKVSHHGSITGMIPDELVNKVLKTDGTKRYAALSAYPDLKKLKKQEQKWTYENVPRTEVLQEIERRANLRQTVQVPDGSYIDYYFEGNSSNVTIKP